MVLPAGIARSTPADSCVICGQPAGEERNVLVNGTMYHGRCLAKLVASVETRVERVGQLESKKCSIQEEISKSRSLLSRLLLFFGAGNPPRADANQELRRVDAAISAIRARLERLSLVLGRVYDYWPTYPPDWEERRQAKLSEQPFCEVCGRSMSLNVHHQLRIGSGGNHTEANLVVLCRACHEDRHGGRPFRYSGEAEESHFSRRLALIRDAIQKTQCVHFSYSKYYGEKSVRTIRPTRLELVGRSQSLCVHGWCYLRNAERVFAIKRMRRVRAVDAPE